MKTSTAILLVGGLGLAAFVAFKAFAGPSMKPGPASSPPPPHPPPPNQQGVGGFSPQGSGAGAQEVAAWIGVGTAALGALGSLGSFWSGGSQDESIAE